MHPCALSQGQAADTGHHDPSMKSCSLRAPILSFSPKQTRQNLCLSGRTQASLDLNVFTGKIHLISLMEIWGWNRGNDDSRKSIVSSSACQSGWGRTVPARYKNCVCTTNTGPNNHGNRQQHLHVITFHLITLLSVRHREPFRIFLRFPQVALSHPSPAY